MVTLAPTLIIVLFSEFELSCELCDRELDQPRWGKNGSISLVFRWDLEGLVF
jgi:hypothetical protein